MTKTEIARFIRHQTEVDEVAKCFLRLYKSTCNVFDSDSEFQVALNETLGDSALDSFIMCYLPEPCDAGYDLIHEFTGGKLSDQQVIDGLRNLYDEWLAFKNSGGE